MHFYRNFDPEDYVRLLANSRCIIGNSSSGLREGAYLGAPCVNVGTRQAGRERGPNVIDVPHEASAIAQAIRTQLDHGKYPSSNLVGDGTAAKQMAEVLSTFEFNIQKKISYIN